MASWEDIRADVKCVASKTIRKTEELAETASMHVKLARLISRCDKQFEKLGKLTYKQLKSDDVSYAESISAVIAHIDALTLQIARQKAKIEKVKAQAAAEKAKKETVKAEEVEVTPDAQQAQECVETIKEIISDGIDE